MKNFLFTLLFIFSITLTTQAKSIDYEKPSTTIVADHYLGSLQVEATSAYEIGNNQDNQRLDVYHFTSDRYVTSYTSSRYSKDNSINKGTDIDTYINKEQSSNSIITQSWRSDRSDLCLRRAERSGQDLQRGYDASTVNNRKTTVGADSNQKRNTQIAKTISIYRKWSGTYFSLVAHKSHIQTKVVTIAPNPIPLGWFRTIT